MPDRANSGEIMGVLKEDDHETLRMWALENSFEDPESPIDRRLEKMHKDRRA